MKDKELVDKILNGDKNAFKELMSLYKDKVLNVSYSILKNIEDSEDVGQEVFIEVYRSISQFKWKSSLSTWIIRIAITRSLNLSKKRKIKRWLGSLPEIFSFSNDEFKEKSSDERGPFENLGDKETRTALTSAINSLPESQKVAFSLSKIDGMNIREICEIMNLTESAVESLLSRAKSNLKKSLREFYEKDFKT